MVNILNELAANGYWCSDPPVITEHPEKEQFIDLGHNMSISCQANSSLSLAYSWKRDGFLSPNHAASTFTKLTDEDWAQTKGMNVWLPIVGSALHLLCSHTNTWAPTMFEVYTETV